MLSIQNVVIFVAWLFTLFAEPSPAGCFHAPLQNSWVATGWLESITLEFAEIEMVRKTHPTLLNGVRGSLYSQYSYPEMAEIKTNTENIIELFSTNVF